MKETQHTITEWQFETFGQTTIMVAFERMQKEYWELRDCVHAYCTSGEANKPSIAKVAAEMADVYITMCRLALELNVDLHAEVDAKMDINRSRKWEVFPDGTGQHVRNLDS
jgi:hypothetical protein